MTSSRKERPILFSAPMVRALLDGSKTQTRRLVKGLSEKMWIEESAKGGFNVCYDSQPCSGAGVWEVTEHSHPIACPYGMPGDRLWVRETWSTHACFDDVAPGQLTTRSLHYWADGKVQTGKGRPSIHMPRWASRIDLEVTGVRVERLQDISEADAIAEGAPPSHPSIDTVSREFGYPDFSRSWYAQLWDSINGEGAWARNEWVWVVEFRRLEASHGRA